MMWPEITPNECERIYLYAHKETQRYQKFHRRLDVKLRVAATLKKAAAKLQDSQYWLPLRFCKPDTIESKGCNCSKCNPDSDYAKFMTIPIEDTIIKQQEHSIAQLEAQLAQARVCGSCGHWHYGTDGWDQLVEECKLHSITNKASFETCPDWTPIGGE